MKRFTFLIMFFLFVNILLAQNKTIDITQSVIQWKGSKKTGTLFGVVPLLSGVIVSDSGMFLVGSKFEIDLTNIEIQSDETTDEKKAVIRDISRQSFFNVAQYPKATFVITGTKNEVSDLYNTIITGNLTIKDITNSISFPAKVSVDASGKVVAMGTAVFNRHDWDLTFSNMLKESILNETIEVTATIVAQ